MKAKQNKAQHHNRLTRSESSFHRDHKPQPSVNARLPSGGWCALTLCQKMKPQKTAFLDKFNPKRTLDKALTSGITASVQHNSLYRESLQPKIKEAVKCEWRDFLQGLVNRYATQQSEAAYERDIEALKDLMNSRFPHAFRDDRHPKFGTDPGFRISHAQKSISVFLKHLWCMGQVATPPQCPVDRVILTKACAKDPRWGRVNTIKEHRDRIIILKAARPNQSEPLAEWELRTF